MQGAEMKQTLAEIAIAIFTIGWIALVGFGIYAAIHFILKFW